MKDGLGNDDEFMFEEYTPDEPVKLRPQNSQPNHMSEHHQSRAPTMIIEAVRVGRPKKVLGFLCGIISLLFLVVSTSSSSWMQTKGTRAGLFQECLKLEKQWAKDRYMPNDSNAQSCQMSDCFSWPMLVCGALNIFGCGLVAISLLLTVYGMKTLQLPRKFITYHVVVGLNCIAILAFFATMLTFPILFYRRFSDPNIKYTTEHAHGGEVSISWAVITSAVGLCGLAVFTILIAVDRSSEEIVYEERILQDDEEED